jgi:dolichol-phosphate mannosyltransferase
VKGVSAIVIIPTYNERDNITPLVEALIRHDGVGVMVVDDASPDGTGAAADALPRRQVSRSR